LQLKAGPAIAMTPPEKASGQWLIFVAWIETSLAFSAWAATLQNFGVTALVAWLLAILTATQGFPSEHPYFSDRPPVGTLSGSLGYVGMPTVAALPNPLPSMAGSAAVLPQGRP
jgi:hypothetical protein